MLALDDEDKIIEVAKKTVKEGLSVRELEKLTTKKEDSGKKPKEGKEEKKQVLEWAEALDSQRYHAAYVSLINQKNSPPEILWITKK